MQKAWTQKEEKFLKGNYLKMTNNQLADSLGRSITGIEHKISRMGLKSKVAISKGRNAKIRTSGNLLNEMLIQEKGISMNDLDLMLRSRNGDILVKKLPVKAKKLVRFAIVSDTHFGSKHEKIDELTAFYKLAKKEGCKFVLHAGDMVAGNDVFENQVNELKVWGSSNQIKHVIEHYPRGLNTYFIQGNHDNNLANGDNHLLFETIGKQRKDMHYMGDTKALFKTGDLNIMVVHPKSYTINGARAILNKMQERPDILILGHTHQSAYFCDKNTHLIYAGAFEGGGRYLDKQFMYPRVGGWIVEAWKVNNEVCLTTKFIKF